MFFKRFFLSCLLAISMICGALGFLALPTEVLAQTTDGGLSTIGSTINLPNTDPRVIAARIINIALSTLGIIFVILIIYAGFLYMTSGGDSAKTQKAIAMIRNGIIGLIIILLSWALARYILTRLMEAVGTGTGGGGGTPGGGGVIGGGGGSTQFSIRSITPNGSVITRKVIVKIVFSRPVDATSAVAAGMITVTRVSDSSVIAGTVTAEGSVARFIPSTPCPAPNEDRFCYDENTEYRVTVSPQLRSVAGQTLTCGGFAPDCTGTFRSGTTVDITPPTVAITEPINGFGVPTDSIVNVRAFTQDGTGVSYVEFRDNGAIFGEDAPTGATPISFNARAQWDTAGLPVGTTRSLQARAYDVDSGVADSAAVSVVLRAPHCFNGSQDQGETGIDCGGISTSPDYCGACTGGTCTVDTDCASGVCQAGFCVERPIITGVDPGDGAPGSYVTIHGANFGSNGTVSFLGSGTPVTALPPTACSNAGITTWSPTQVVVEVPPGAQSGPLRVMNASSGLTDDTNTAPDPVIPDFIVNDVHRPGLCAIVPSQGRPSDRFTLYGTGFGTTASAVQFGTRTLTASTWTDNQIQSAIPNVAVGAYDVSVNVGAMTSNAVSMQVVSTETGGSPVIASIDPAQGPVGTMVTISGSNFGSTVGSVFFEREGTGEIALADTSLPTACTANYWKDSTIVVKVPRVFTQVGTGNVLPGTYAVYVKTARPTAPNSNRMGFLVNTDPLAPGICSVVPRIAPVGTRLAIYGEGFTAGPGTVRYFDRITDPSATWADGQIDSTIPVGAQSGALTAQPASGLVSNPYNIQVRNCNDSPDVCSTNETCCSDGACIPEGSVCATPPTRAMYAWQFSTGIIPRAPRVVEQCASDVLPSPSPWSQRTGGNEVCLNVRPIVLFSTMIEPSSVALASGNVGLYRCTGADADPCQAIAPTPEVLTDIRLIADTENRQAIILSPTSLAQSTWYQIRLSTGIRGAGMNGLPMQEDSARCGAGNSYCFTFRTRGDATPCAIGSVEVAPDPYTASDLETPIDYLAVPRAQGDICQAIACEPYAWTWGTSDARAMVTHYPNPDATIGGEACEQSVTPVAETGSSNPVQITAQAAGTTGAGDLYIKLVPPQVTSYGPNCNQACLNAAIWATFNVPMDRASIVNVSNVRIERCRNESCQELMNPPTIALPVGSIQLTSIPNTSGTDDRFMVISPQSGGVSLLMPGAYYRVILLTGEGSGIRSRNMMPLSGLNNPDGFAWIFRVKQGDTASCQPTSVSVTPVEKYESRVGARQGFFASPFTEADECSEQGQLLMSLTGYNWSIDDTNVARLLNNNGRLDTSSERVTGCNGSCTQVGSQGQAGKTARCGDGVVQTVSASYCISGRTRSGSACVILPAGSTGSEECDESSPLCNSQCLWEPVSSITQTNGTCGDGNLQANEDCDFGSVCMGANAASGIADGSSCTLTRTACLGAGGTCEPRETRGCSVFCRHLGSRSGGSTCGNGDVADGEDCDDGNVANGDGCSANCVFEGSSRDITSLCGNGRVEPGEACERNGVGGPWPAGCDQKTCLNTGTTPCVSVGQSSCCGNGLFESGEDCEDGNTVPGDGCSPICKLEGSSEKYPTPSFCGDGVPGTGEVLACEAGLLGDGLIDAYQVAETVGRGTLLPNETLMSTQLHATYQTITGNATYGLRCGYTREDQCSQAGGIDPLVGLSSAGCCSSRPTLVASYPLNAETDVCRNALIYGDFNTEMDTATLNEAFAVGQRVTGATCPSGQTLLTVTHAPKPTGIKGMFARAWNAIKTFFGGRDVYAQAICSGGITGRLSFIKATATDGHAFTRFAFTLDHVLEANSVITVVFRGDAVLTDNSQTTGKTGIRTASGVVSNQDWRWSFTTGAEICVINEVDVVDTLAEHPGLFLRADEAHAFTATARSWHGNRMVAISSTEEYGWNWQNWAISNSQIAGLDPVITPSDLLNLSMSSSTVTSKRVSGTGYVTARVYITRDSANIPSTVDRTIQGTMPITVNLCENPWPSRIDAPFRDEANSPNLVGTPFEAGPDFYNFSTMYCRDAGELGPLADLPSLVINAVPTNAVDASQGILRQYLFTFGEPELKKDAIGIRIASNPLHLSPEEWYLSKGFTGKPQPLTIDGYQAIRDGRTVYISAVSTDGPNTRLYSNIYLVSYNDGAEPVTRQIYDALLSTLSFNRNIQTDVSSICQDAGGSIAGISGAPVACSSDINCDSYGDGIICANFKTKVQRDLVRLADFEKMTRLLDTTKSKVGLYPMLQEGSYISGMSTSLWPSWKESLEKTVGATVPTDPLNRFVTCGRCSTSNTACTADSDCPANGGTCVAQEGFDPKTCWNTQSLQFACAIGGSTTVPTSRIYMYQALSQGKRYRLSSEFEIRPPNSMDPTANWWWPPLPTDNRQCVSGGLKGAFCATDADCRVCPNNNCTNVPTVAGSCQIVGGSYKYTDICRGETLGQSTTCGDGVVGTTASTPEVCETTGPTSFRYTACQTLSGASGYRRQVCNACQEYIDDTASTCIAGAQCGNGKVDGSCNGDITRPCQSASDCGGASGASCVFTEICDDGVQNGTYNHCNRTCSGYGASCGDGMISAGEKCDLGSSNAEWVSGPGSNSCNLSCSGLSGNCGDGIISKPFEQCDGNTETTTKGLCTDESTPCSTSADCPSGQSCGSACPAVHVCTGANSASGLNGEPCDDATSNAACVAANGTCSTQAYQTTRSRTCFPMTCQMPSFWSVCRFEQTCGNGKKEGAEACDDGNQIETDGCTTSCKVNKCGDGYTYKGVEECDMGTQNGQGCSTSAEYGSTCTSCSTSCKFQLTQGGFCGDNVVTAGSAEQCDGDATVPAYGTASNQLACTSLGYDYLKPGLTKIQCSQSCGYTGCAYCGDPAPAGTTDALYQGTAEGILFDTLFQQPVPGARVTLFYRGLQISVTNSNARGYFQFTNLDRHTGCDQYRIVIDSYADNPLTKNFDESSRGGYMTVQTPPFTAYLTSDTGTYNGVMRGASIAVDNSTYTSYTIPQFNMLPRLREKEYIVQLWWTPRDGSADAAIVNFRNRIGTGDEASQVAASASVYGGYQDELHDLVVRTPYTYAPGTYASCSLSKKPKAFNPADTNPPTRPDGTVMRAGRNYTIYGVDSTQVSGLTNGGLDNTVTPSKPYFSAYNFVPYVTTVPTWDPKKRDWSWQVGLNGVDQVSAINGMISCTNKIRASAGRVCAEVTASGSVVSDFGKRYGCVVDADCVREYKFSLTPATAGNSIVCSNAASELDRTGSIQVLNGREGAYLFCFHPEWPDSSSLRDQSKCSNFIVPPQSVFIHGISGVYDVLVSKFRMFVSGHSNEPARRNGGSATPGWDDDAGNELSIRRWLERRDASIRVYDQNGLYKQYRYNDLRNNGGSAPDQQSPWSGFDEMPWLLPTGAASPNIFVRQTALDRYNLLYPISTSPVWTPISIDVTNKEVDEWNGGNYAADYRYFSDLFMNDTEMYVSWVGGGYQPNTTAACVQYSNGTVEPNLQNGWGICNGPDYYWDVNNSPACRTSDMSVGTQNSMASIRSVVGTGDGYLGVERCTRACQSDTDCPSPSGIGARNFCVPRGNCASVAGPYTPPSR